MPISEEDFAERLLNFGGPLLRDFPMDNLVIAGGSVLQCLQKDHLHPDFSNLSDIDLFVVADTDEEATETFDSILRHLSREESVRLIDHGNLLVARSPFAVTFCFGDPQRNLQLILVRYRCMADIIFNFDIDCCQILWTGSRVLATLSAVRALRTGVNFADPTRRGGDDYEWRLSKYATRGFLVAVPGLDISKVKREYIRNSCYCYHEGELKRAHLEFKKGSACPIMNVGERSIEGLAKLISLSTTFEPSQRRETESQVPHRRLQLGQENWPGAQIDSLGTGNYLLVHSEFKRVKVWIYQTPPYPPPLLALTTPVRARTVDTGGGILIRWEFTPSDNLQLLRGHGSPTDDLDQTRLVCYDLLNVLQSIDCPNVRDAKVQFPAYPFTGARDHLNQFLEFPPSSDIKGRPWIRLKEEDWTKGVYES